MFSHFEFSQKNSIEKNSRITFDNVLLTFFNEKVDFMQNITFSIHDHTQYFPHENHFLYRKEGVPKNWSSKNIFSESWSDRPPPIVLLRKRQKVSKFDLSVTRQKL